MESNKWVGYKILKQRICDKVVTEFWKEDLDDQGNPIWKLDETLEENIKDYEKVS